MTSTHGSEVTAAALALTAEQQREIAARVVGDDPVSQTTALRIVQETLHALAGRVAPYVRPQECAASGAGHRDGPHGPGGEMQCAYCGQPPTIGEKVDDNERPADEPDWDECIRQAEVATGLRVERHTLSIVIREVRRWLAGRTTGAAAQDKAKDVPGVGAPAQAMLLDTLRQLRDAVSSAENRDDERQPRIAAALRLADAAIGVGPSTPDLRTSTAEWLLYEHDEGWFAVSPSSEAATFAHGDPGWRRVGPVEVPLSSVARVGKLRSALRAIAETLDDHELRQAAREALEADDAAGVALSERHTKQGHTRSTSTAPASEKLAQFERLAHRMGELWERCQGKGWARAESAEFDKLRDERMPALRAEILGLLAPADSVSQAEAASASELVQLLDEVRGCYTTDDDLPDNLLPRIDAAIRSHRPAERSSGGEVGEPASSAESQPGTFQWLWRSR